MKLSEMQNLPIRIAIYIPSTYNVNIPIDNTEIVNNTAEMFSGLFGGSTATESTGYYISESKELISEKVTIVYSYTDKKTFLKNEDKILNYANLIKSEMKQESISIEYQNKLYFV